MSKRGQVQSASPLGKSGQVTVFLIIGIAMLLLAAGFFFIFSNIKKAQLEVESEESRAFLDTRGALQSFVETCIKQTVDPSLYLLALQGGVIYPDEDSLILLTDYGLVNYAWLNGVRGLSREKMERDLGTYLEENIDFCFAGFETFERQNVEVVVDYGGIGSQVTIRESSVNAQLDLPLQIILPTGDEVEMNRFSAQVGSGLGIIFSLIEGLSFPDINPSDLLSYPYQPTIFPYDESVVIYSLAEETGETPLAFMFAVRDDFPENEPPVLEFIADKVFVVGDRWQETLFAEDPNKDFLQFSSDSNDFPVADDGTIDVEVTAVGTNTVVFIVEDGRGGEDEQEVSIMVVEAGQ